ncbi:MAG: LytTR family DNA-binding domain-containing protein [Ignavibacteriales bacterium]|nr:LytTR family DNA-binding domain-containing protein [Ignavibacteriales bacterium]
MNGFHENISPPSAEQLSVAKGPTRKEDAKTIRVAIVDDEALARRAMRRALEEVSDVEVIGECSNGEEAIEMLSKIRPDLIFLDIEMPRLNGMELAQRLMEKGDPCIVFVTAYEKYALDAFKVQAADYVLKPINEFNIREAIERVADRIRQRRRQETDSRLDSIIQLIEQQKKDLQPAGSLDRLTIKNNGRIYFVETTSIDWIQAEGNYVTLHAGTVKHLLRIKMNQLEERLNPKQFFRIHRSTIVNIQSIKELRSYFNGTYMILLSGNTKIFSSRGYRENVEQILNQIV